MFLDCAAPFIKYLRWRVAGGSRVILCLLPNSRLMEFRFSSRIRNALLSENNYEIFSSKERIHPNIWLHGSCTAMGTITYTLIFTSDEDDDLLGRPFLTWMDTILTYNDQDPLEVSLPIAAKRTLSFWLTSIILMERRTITGARFWNEPAAKPNFWRQCDVAFHAITCLILNAYYSFASGASEEENANTPVVEDVTSLNYLP